MATLIGRDAWHVGAVLSNGRLTHYDATSGIAIIDRGCGFGTLAVHTSQVLLSPEAALRAARDTLDYWDSKVRELENLLS